MSNPTIINSGRSPSKRKSNAPSQKAPKDAVVSPTKKRLGEQLSTKVLLPVLQSVQIAPLNNKGRNRYTFSVVTAVFKGANAAQGDYENPESALIRFVFPTQRQLDTMVGLLDGNPLFRFSANWSVEGPNTPAPLPTKPDYHLVVESPVLPDPPDDVDADDLRAAFDPNEFLSSLVLKDAEVVACDQTDVGQHYNYIGGALVNYWPPKANTNQPWKYTIYLPTSKKRVTLAAWSRLLNCDLASMLGTPVVLCGMWVKGGFGGFPPGLQPRDPCSIFLGTDLMEKDDAEVLENLPDEVWGIPVCRSLAELKAEWKLKQGEEVDVEHVEVQYNDDNFVVDDDDDDEGQEVIANRFHEQKTHSPTLYAVLDDIVLKEVERIQVANYCGGERCVKPATECNEHKAAPVSRPSANFVFRFHADEDDEYLTIPALIPAYTLLGSAAEVTARTTDEWDAWYEKFLGSKFKLKVRCKRGYDGDEFAFTLFNFLA